MKKNTKFAFTVEILGMFVIATLFLLFFSIYVPFNMDEFCHYHVLGCQYYPLNQLNHFREACNAYDLAPLPNLYLPLRSYHYEGIVQCFLYYPLFLLWHSPYSARLLGVIMLGLQAFLLHRLFRTNILVSFIFLLFYMPYAFQHIVDTGPISFQTTSVFLIYYLLEQWMTSMRVNKKLSWQYPLSIGTVMFLDIWSKLAYFAMLPALVFMILYSLIMDLRISYSLSKLKILVCNLLIMIASVTIPTFLLLNSIDRNGKKYSYLLQHPGILGILNFSKLPLLFYFTNPLLAAHRIFNFDNAPLVTSEGVLLIYLAVIFIAWGIISLRFKNTKTTFLILNLFYFFMTLFLLSKSRETWAMQHVVLSMPFLVIAFFYLFSKIDNHKFRILFAIFFIAINLSLYLKLPHLQYNDSNHPSKIQLNELLNNKFADKYVFIVIDWGMYYIKSLYGKNDQCVLYIEPLNDKKQIIQLKEGLNKIHRKALFIGRTDSDSNLKLIETEFPTLANLNTPFDTGKWQVLYEK